MTTLHVASDGKPRCVNALIGSPQSQWPMSDVAMNQQSNSDILASETLDQIQGHVQRRLKGRVRRFRLSVEDGGLVLRGCTKTYYAKQLAQHAVMECVGVPIQANEIEVG